MLEPLAPPLLAIAVFLLLGLIVGSFLNVVIFRLPIMLEREWAAQCAELKGEPAPPLERYNLAVPRSACPACGHRITALENVPVVSWLWLRGRCAACSARISARYPIVEAASGLLAAALIDADTKLLPDNLTLPLMWLGLIANAFGLFVPLSDALWGAVGGYVSLWTVYWLFRLATGKEGMGYGDFKLLAALGAWLGWQMLPVIVLLSSVVGALIGIILIVTRGRDRSAALPFGPYLAAAGALALFWGRPLVDLYLGR